MKPDGLAHKIFYKIAIKEKIRKPGRLTSLPVVRQKTHPKNKAYLQRRLKQDYVRNTGDNSL